MTEIIDPELQPIARFVEGCSREQVLALRERIVNEVLALEARFPVSIPKDDPGRFELARQRLTCARRRREVDFLNSILDASPPLAARSP